MYKLIVEVKAASREYTPLAAFYLILQYLLKVTSYIQGFWANNFFAVYIAFYYLTYCSIKDLCIA
jgi:hypothetical protein